MTNEAYLYSLKNIKKTVSYKNVRVMIINIKYPQFEKCGPGKKEEAFVAKINKFYTHTAEHYAKYISEKYAKKAAKVYSSNGNIMLSFLMDCTVSYNTESIISVFCDLTYFDGQNKKKARFSQNWSVEKSAILPASFCFDTSGRAKKHITDTITDIADKNSKSKNFSYYSNYRNIIKRKFSFDNFYFVPNGTAFFYNEGVLSEDGNVCVFVIQNDKIDGVLKVM